MGKLLIPSDASHPPSGSAFKPDSSAIPLQHTIAWNKNEPFDVDYTVCCVRVTALTDKIVTVRFINTNDGTESKTDRELPLDNLGVVYPDPPSTLPDTNEFKDGKTVCILLVNKAKLKAETLADAEASAADGKWPRTSGDALRFLRFIATLPDFQKLISQFPEPMKELLDQLGVR